MYFEIKQQKNWMTNKFRQTKNQNFHLYQQQTNLSIGGMQATLAFQLCEQLINTP